MRWWQRLTPRTLAGKFLALQLAVLTLVLIVAGIVSVRQSTSQFLASSGDRILAATENLAGNPLVKSRDKTLNLAATLAPVAEAARVQSGASVVLLADPDHLVIASTDPTQVGTELTLPNDVAWKGRAWDGDLTLGGQRLSVATVPVYSTAGDVLGLALVGEEYPSVLSILLNGVPELLLLLALAAVAGVTGSWLLARRIKKQTHGLEPAQIATLADHREALLHSIREGVLGVGPDGRITVANDGARLLLDLPADCVGRLISDLDLDTDLLDVLNGRRVGTDLVVLYGGRVLVVNRRTAKPDQKSEISMGSVTTLRDRSELIAVQRQLGATRNATDTLRAQTHEFDNQLHIISGLVQLGQYDKIHDYVTSLTKKRLEIDSAMTARIEDPPLAALLMAKSSLAAESGVKLTISPGSRCPTLLPDASNDIATVVGNLIDNALDALANSSEASIKVEVIADDFAVRVAVSDSGPGVPADKAERVFERGYTTKTAAVVGGRGIGLSLVKFICQQRGGSVTVSSSDGAEFIAVVPLNQRDGESPTPSSADQAHQTRISESAPS